MECEKKMMLLIVIICSIAYIHCAICPQKELLYPCDCVSDGLSICGAGLPGSDFDFKLYGPCIRCGGNAAFDLRSKFQQINSGTNINLFFFNNTAIREIPDNVFQSTQFRNVVFNSETMITRIHSNAFASIAHNVESVVFYNGIRIDKNSAEFQEFFDSLKVLTNAREIGITYNEEFTSLPTFAFREFANLNLIALYYNKINRISSHAFQFANQVTNRSLTVTLDNNQLTSSSFDISSFDVTNRPLSVTLRNNRIEYLDENVFMQLLLANEKNTIYMNDNPVVCDCRMKWIMEKKIKQTQIWHMYCTNKDNRSFWSLADADFDC